MFGVFKIDKSEYDRIFFLQRFGKIGQTPFQFCGLKKYFPLFYGYLKISTNPFTLLDLKRNLKSPNEKEISEDISGRRRPFKKQKKNAL